MKAESKEVFKRGDHVVFKCTNPATGFVTRVAKDGSWTDVQWNAGLNYTYPSRQLTKNMMKTNQIFNRIATDPFMQIVFPEAFK